MMKLSHTALALLILVSPLALRFSQAGPSEAPASVITLLAGTATESAAVTEATGRGDSFVPIASPATAVEGTEAGIRSSEADEYLRRSDSHFNAGRQRYFEGNLGAAHREFDQAVDVLLKVPDSVPDHSRLERRLDEICNLIYRFDIEKLGAGQKADEEKVGFDEAPIDALSRMTFGVDEKLAPKLQSDLTQVASGIPLELLGPVPGLIKFFSTTDSGRRTLLAGFRRSGRYRPLIQRILAEEGVPQELIYLAQAESGFLPRAVSNKRAVGMWQFIADTGTIYKLKRSGEYDERLDPEKATRAAARMLKYLHERYGDWYLAMAAYNCGAGAVDRAVERTGYADYWELLRRHSLPRETANYVPIIVAMTIIAKNPQDYGLDSITLDEPVDYDSITVTAPTHLDLIADATLQPVSVIRDLNPSLLGRLAPAGFQVHVPAGAAAATQEALEIVPPSNRHAWRLHHVSTGDTLAAIATSYHLRPERIAAVNRSSDSIEVGDTLLIPALDPPLPPRQLKGHRVARGRYLAQHAGHVAASRHVSSHAPTRLSTQALHRKAAIRSARLR